MGRNNGAEINKFKEILRQDNDKNTESNNMTKNLEANKKVLAGVYVESTDTFIGKLFHMVICSYVSKN